MSTRHAPGSTSATWILGLLTFLLIVRGAADGPSWTTALLLLALVAGILRCATAAAGRLSPAEVATRTPSRAYVLLVAVALLAWAHAQAHLAGWQHALVALGVVGAVASAEAAHRRRPAPGPSLGERTHSAV